MNDEPKIVKGVCKGCGLDDEVLAENQLCLNCFLREIRSGRIEMTAFRELLETMLHGARQELGWTKKAP